MFGYGSLLRAAFGTRGSKLSLADDELSRVLHYVTDGGSLLNYCDYWPGCVKSLGGCKPMAETLTEVSAYHKSIDLKVGVYHVDPFWFSHDSNGGESKNRNEALKS